MANKKTAKKLNRKPKVGDIISISFDKDRPYLVLVHDESVGHRFLLLRLDDGDKRWYDYILWMRRWKKLS